MASASDEKSSNGTDETTTATFLRSSVDPDITIIVGDKTYHEYGQSLRCWSSYFDRALASGMKEQETSQFEFPDRDPKHWEWIISLMAPLTKERISMETVSVAVDWFDFLCSDLGLEACDEVLAEYVNCDEEISPEKLGRAMAHIGTTVKINLLPKTKAACFSVIRDCLLDHAIYFTKSYLETITALIKDDVDCRDRLLGPLKTHLPSSMTEEQVDLLIAGDMLHEIINLQLEHLKTNARTAFLQRLAGRPRSVQHDVATKTISFDDFCTAGAPNMLTTKGVLYYELEVLKNDGCTQFGFAKKDGIGLSNEQLDLGTGDNGTSWAVDGLRGKKWNDRLSSNEWSGSWEVGTALGFAANIDKGMIAISKDGDWSSQDAEDGFGVVFTDASIQEGVFPSFTGSRLELKYCLDEGSFKYGPPADAIWEEA